jgi:hypothetical protein
MLSRKNSTLHKQGNGPTTKETYKKVSIYTQTSTNYMKHTHATEDYTNRSHKEIETVCAKLIGRPMLIAILILILKLRQAVQ